MYLDHRITAKIARVLNMVDVNALLLDRGGNVLLPEGDTRVFTLPDALFANPTMPLVYGAVTLIGTGDEQPVFICLHGDSDDIKKCAVLCAELVNAIMREDMNTTSREQILRMMLRGEIEASEYDSVAQEYALSFPRRLCVFYLYFSDTPAETALSMLQAGMDEEEELICEVGRHALALIKSVDEEEEDMSTLNEFAQALEDTFLTETGKNVLIGVSDPYDELSGLRDAFEEARDAINVGRLYHAEKNIFFYRGLLLERFLGDITPEMSAAYNSKIFNRKTARLFNEEMVHTIETFFDNSLNLSETARKLYIHRNTLVYRLEKVQKTIGLDLRNFDDAVTFKLLLLLGKNNGSRKVRL